MTSVLMGEILTVICLAAAIVSVLPILKRSGQDGEIVRFQRKEIEVLTKEKNDLIAERKEFVKRIERLESRVGELERIVRMKNEEIQLKNNEIVILSKHAYTNAANLPAPAKKHVLFVSSSPINSSALNTGIEARGIEEILRKSGYTFKAIQYSRPADLTQAILEQRPDILHFSGHGLNGQLALEGNDRVAKLITTDTIVRLLRAKQVTGIVLNACDSAINQKPLLTVADWVIGMKQEVQDPTAIAFSDGFYRAIAADEPIDTAFDIAIANAGMESAAEMDVPVLVKRGY